MGIDLNQYQTNAAADDVEDVRRALGIAQWNLLGGSYGTRLALEVAVAIPAASAPCCWIRSARLTSI
jgi:pimeloyl-ACP methyl ester carboxylesterase